MSVIPLDCWQLIHEMAAAMRAAEEEVKERGDPTDVARVLEAAKLFAALGVYFGQEEDEQHAD